jgi:hypothetical protein
LTCNLREKDGARRCAKNYLTWRRSAGDNLQEGFSFLSDGGNNNLKKGRSQGMNEKAVILLLELLSDLSTSVQKSAHKIEALEEAIRLHLPKTYKSYQNILADPKRRGFFAGHSIAIANLRKELLQDRGA